MLFASDRRFQPLHQEYSEDWGLRILSVRASDAGWYFCQISTSPPVSHQIYLNVVGKFCDTLRVARVGAGHFLVTV